MTFNLQTMPNGPKILIITGILLLFTIVAAIIYSNTRREIRNHHKKSPRRSPRASRPQILHKIPKVRNYSNTTAIQTASPSQKQRTNPVQIHIVRQLEQDTVENRKYATEFLRRARTIESLLQYEDHPLLNAFLLNDVPQYVQQLVDNKQRIEHTMYDLENGGVQLEEQRYLVLTNAALHELKITRATFEHDVISEFEKEHEYLMEQIVENGVDVEHVCQLQILYEKHVTWYGEHYEWIINTALRLQAEMGLSEDDGDDEADDEFEEIRSIVDTQMTAEEIQFDDKAIAKKKQRKLRRNVYMYALIVGLVLAAAMIFLWQSGRLELV